VARKEFEQRLSETRKRHADDVRQRSAERARLRRERAEHRARERQEAPPGPELSELAGWTTRRPSGPAEYPSATRREPAAAAEDAPSAPQARSHARQVARRRKTEAQQRHVQTLRRLRHETLRLQSANWIRREELEDRIDKAFDNPKKLG
jgi:hypothetical protein